MFLVCQSEEHGVLVQMWSSLVMHYGSVSDSKFHPGDIGHHRESWDGELSTATSIR